MNLQRSPLIARYVCSIDYVMHYHLSRHDLTGVMETVKSGAVKIPKSDPERSCSAGARPCCLDTIYMRVMTHMVDGTNTSHS